MSGLNIAGIASGIDTNSIISQMVALETRSLVSYQQRIAQQEAERVAYGDLNGRLQALQTATSRFSSNELFSSLTATSSRTDLVQVSADQNAPRGSHQIKVLQAAQAHRIGGGGISDPIGTKIAAGFEKTNFGAGLKLGQVEQGSHTITAVDSSTFDYSNHVTLSGQYTGGENLDVSVELLSDATGANGTVDLRISTDGQNYETFNNVDIVDGQINLDSATYFGSNGISVTIDNADTSMKDGDQISFRTRGTASLEFSTGNGERKELALDPDITLAEMVKNINDDSSLGIRADILNDGSTTNPYRLVLTSLVEGTQGEINILSNSTSISLDGVFAEDPVKTSSTFTGSASIEGSLKAGVGNNSLVFEAMSGGGPSSAKFRISSDGGLTFHDNNGAGFGLIHDGDEYVLDLDTALQDNGSPLFSDFIGIDLKLTADGSSLSANDRITIDLYDAELRSAQNAIINVDGITMTKTSNTIDDVFEGITLDIQNASPNESVTVNVSENVGDVSTALSGFVEAYNSVMGLIQSQSAFNPEENAQAPILMGSATLRQIQSGLQRYTTGRIGVLNGNGVSSLSDIGITTNSKTGLLTFDSGKLSNLLENDANGVRSLLSRFGDIVEGSGISSVDSTSATQAGTYDVKVTQARQHAEVTGGIASTINTAERLTIRINEDAQGTGKINSLTVDLTVDMTATQQAEAIQTAFDQKDLALNATLENGKLVIRHTQYGDDYELEVTSNQFAGNSGFSTITASGIGVDLKGTIDGIEADVVGNQLVGRKGHRFEGLKVQVSNGFVGDAGTVRLNDGLGTSLTNLLDSFTGSGGLLSEKLQRFDGTISRFEEQMNRVNDRATQVEERLRRKFVQLEVTLGRLNATSNYLNAQLAALPGVQIN
jgi:flagellar hook-associated protein 2